MRPARRIKIGLLVAVIAFAIIVGPRLAVHAAYSGVRFETPAEVPTDEAPRIALVFGAGLSAGGSRPSIVLYDRVATAVELYHAGRAYKLLMSGDNRFVEYNEPEVMRETAVALGVPEQDIVLDYAGRRTYDSCYRAKEIFGVERAVLVTQSFHLDRALYLCNSMGVDAIGVAADRHLYADGAHRWWHLREVPAVLSAWFDLNVRHPIPVMGEKLPIDSTGTVAETGGETGDAVAAQEPPEPTGNADRPEAGNAADSTANANATRGRGSR